MMVLTRLRTRISSIYAAPPDTSVARIQDSIPKIDFGQGSQEKCPSEAGKHNDIIGAASTTAEGNDRHISRLAKSSSSYEKPSFMNDHDKHNSSLEKEELDGSIQVQPMGDFGATGWKTLDSEGQNNPISGRITRFRSSNQQTSGMSKSSRLPKSASYNLTGSSAQQSGVTEEVNVLDFSLGSYASKTSTTEKT
ncbi:hypothetical protein Tco_1161202 [Tanacetum coccineum]